MKRKASIMTLSRNKDSIDQHPQKEAIEMALLRGDSISEIARKYEIVGSPEYARLKLYRHKHKMGRVIEAYNSAKDRSAAEELIDKTNTLWLKALGGVEEAEKGRVLTKKGEPVLDAQGQIIRAPDLPGLATMLSEARNTLRLQGEFTGVIGNSATPPSTNTTVNVLALPKQPGVPYQQLNITPLTEDQNRPILPIAPLDYATQHRLRIGIAKAVSEAGGNISPSDMANLHKKDRMAHIRRQLEQVAAKRAAKKATKEDKENA